MAVDPSQFPVTRDQVYEWLQDYDGPFKDLKEYLHQKVDALGLDTELVNSPQGETHIVDVIASDLGSYV